MDANAGGGADQNAERGSNLLLRCASQSSLDESSQRPPQPELVQPPTHASKMLEYLHQMRREETLCDVRLVAGEAGEAGEAGRGGGSGEGGEGSTGEGGGAGRGVAAHRAVLAAGSPYFRAMFTQFDERSQDSVTIQNVDPQALESLVDYLYCPESLEVTEENVQALLPAANLLQIAAVRDLCCAFLAAQLHATNCLGIRAFAELHACRDLAAAAHLYIERHFAEVVESEEFLSLGAGQLGALLASDRLRVPSEERVFESVVSWVNHAPAARRHHLADLMEHVRLPLMSQECLVSRVQTEPLLRGDLRCKDLLIEALTYHLLRAEQRPPCVASARARPRQPPGTPKVLLVVGGQAPKAIRNCEAYDLQEGKWHNAGEMLSRRCRAGVAVVGGCVYAVGGFNGMLRVSSVDVYDVAADTWSSAPPMDARRSTLGVAVIQHHIYAVGGFDGATGLSSAEAYDTRTRSWRPIASMRTRRSSVGVANLNGKLYAVGGYDGISRQCLASVECYDPDTDTWACIPDMSMRRSGAGVGVLEGVLYAVGGHDGPAVRRSVEAWRPHPTDCAQGEWRAVAPMACARRNAGVTAHHGRLYVVGGDDGTSNLPTVEVYDPVSDSWSTVGSSMSIGRSYAGVCVVDRLPLS